MKKLLSILLALSMIISCVSMMTFVANAEEETTPAGVKVEVTETFDGGFACLRSTAAGLTKDMAVNGKITKDFVIYNTSTTDAMHVYVEYAGNSGWQQLSIRTDKQVPAEGKTIFTVEIPCDAEGKTTNGVDVSALCLRIDIRSGLNTGNAIIIAADEKNPELDTIAGGRQGGTVGKVAVSTVTELPKEPVGIKFEMTKDFESGIQAFFRVESASLTKEMAVDGKITKNFVVYNTSTEAISVQAQYQNGWSDIASLIATKEIAAGAKETITLTVPCDANGTIDGTIALSALCLRFNVEAVEGKTLKNGDAVVVATENNPEVALITVGRTYDGSAVKLEGVAVSKVTELPTVVTPIPAGVKFEVTEEFDGGYANFRSEAAGFTKDMAVDGKITKTYVIYNPSKDAMILEIMFAGNSGWGLLSPAILAAKEIPAEGKETVTLTIPCDAEGKTNGGVDVSELCLRIDVKKQLKVGNAVIIATENNPEVASITKGSKQMGGTSTTGKVAVSTVTELPTIAEPSTSPESTAEPVGVKLEMTMNQAKGVQGFFRLDQSAGVTKDMAVNGKITKTFVLYNVSENALVVEAQYQDGWTNLKELTQAKEIPAGGKATFTFEIPCDANGTIDGTIPVTNLCLRFNIDAVEGSRLKKGDAIVIALENNPEIVALKARTYDGSAVKADGVVVSTVTELPKDPATKDPTTESKPTGDAIPVAMIAMAVVAFAGLAVVVAKKRRED